MIQLLGAKSELCALNNELSDLEVVLQQASQLFGDDQITFDDHPELSVVANSTLRKLQDLKREVEEWNLQLRHKRRKIVTTLPKLKSFRTTLQSLRLQLIAVLSACTT